MRIIDWSRSECIGSSKGTGSGRAGIWVRAVPLVRREDCCRPNWSGLFHPEKVASSETSAFRQERQRRAVHGLSNSGLVAPRYPARGGTDTRSKRWMFICRQEQPGRKQSGARLFECCLAIHGLGCFRFSTLDCTEANKQLAVPGGSSLNSRACSNPCKLAAQA